MKILLIDDNIEIMESLNITFEPMGYECKMFTNPKSAIDAFKSSDFDVIITDFAMSEMTGVDVLREVKSLSTTTSVIFISGYPDMDNVIAALNFGAYAFFLKPFDLKDLFDVLTKVESEAKARRVRQDVYQQLKTKFGNLNVNGVNVEKLLDQIYIR